MSDVGIVVIGRNEGERLVRCLASIGVGHDVVYVDSGSSDASVANAAAAGARVIALDMAIPFTAARARNAGRAALSAECRFIQFVDGDCVLSPGWIGAGRDAIAADDRLGAVFGRLREVDPGASIYNRLCDIEWDGPVGPARYFGGNAMLRASALDAAGGYTETMIAGEEPDLAIRMRARGFAIARLDAPMAGHNAAMTRFGQWWRRMRRSGHAFAELADRNPDPSSHDYAARLRSAWLWGAGPPIAAVVLAFGGIVFSAPVLLALAGIALVLPLLQLGRLALREGNRRSPGEALLVAASWMLAKPAQALGALEYRRARRRGRASPIIEYKAPAR